MVGHMVKDCNPYVSTGQCNLVKDILLTIKVMIERMAGINWMLIWDLQSAFTVACFCGLSDIHNCFGKVLVI